MCPDRTVAAEPVAVPTDYGLRANNDKVVLPAWPKARERDPESSVERRELRPGAFLGIHRELLSQRKFDDRLFLATPEEGEETSKQGDRENGQGPPSRAGFCTSS
jgi:hypothetical protein